MKVKCRSAALAGLGTAVAGAIIVLWPLPRHVPPQAGSQFAPEDLRQIQRAVGHDRWGIARSLVFRHQFLRAFEVCTLGNIQKIHLEPMPKAGLDGSIIFVMGASVECKPQSGQTPLKYEVEPTTNGHWKVVMVAFPMPVKTSNNRVQRAPL